MVETDEQGERREPPRGRRGGCEIVVAADARGGIGRAGSIPWRLAGDMRHFRKLTSGGDDRPAGRQNAVVMGRKTWDSLPRKFRPLPGRHNVVVSRNPSLVVPASVVVAGSLEEALRGVSDRRARGALERCFVIGGAQIYRLAFELPECFEVHLTRLEGSFDCDAFIEPLDDRFVLAERSEPQQEESMRYWFERWTRGAAP